MPPRGHRHGLVGDLALDRREVDHLEARDLDRLAAVEELEVVPGEVAKRVAGAGHLHRNLDHGYRGRVAELRLPLASVPLGVGRGGREQERGRAEQARDARRYGGWTIDEPAFVHFGLLGPEWFVGVGASMRPSGRQFSTFRGIEFAGRARVAGSVTATLRV